MEILAISGSLRAVSSNTAVLEAARALAPEGLSVTLYEELAALPPFNPDLDEESLLPEAVRALRLKVGACDGLFISAPEYAHGMPGALKNALDWLVGSLEFPEKPVALINTSPRAVHAQGQLVEVLNTMSARLVEEAFLTLPLLGRGLDAEGIAADEELGRDISAALYAFKAALC